MESIKSKNRLIISPLFEHIRSYLLKKDDKNKIHYLFVPYIKSKVLEKLVDGIKGKIIIVTTWKPIDLLMDASELELYPLCNKLEIALYINNKIHLKIYSSNLEDMILATANISNKGLGMTCEFNLECAILIENLANSEVQFLTQILKESIYVDQKLYHNILEWYQKQEKIKTKKNFDDFIMIKEKEQFLISALPMTKSIQLLEESYEKLNKKLKIEDIEIRNCVFHDIANYSITIGLSRDQFREKLRDEFFKHPFVKKIDEFIQPEAYFGRIKEWIQNNCTNVPIPSRRELTGNVQVLLEWFEKLGDGRYVIDVPGTHSQRIRKNYS